MITKLQIEADATEQAAVVFGDYEHLVGIVTRPSLSVSRNDAAVIMVTAGMLPSSGPFRLHVDLARSLQQAGVLSLRFDLSGIGESLAVGCSGCSLERAASEISAAIDMLQVRYGIDQVCLVGLCSGADDALFAASKEDRIVGLFCMDGCGYRTAKYYFYRLIRNYLPKLFSANAWRRALNRLHENAPIHESLQGGSDIREFPDRSIAAQQIANLVDRGVDLHFHYTGGVGDYYNHHKQFYDMFASSPAPIRRAIAKVTTSFSPESDHVAFLVEHRSAVVSQATKRLLEMIDASS